MLVGGSGGRGPPPKIACMVLEVALIDVTDPAGFEAAYREARPIIVGTEGCRSVRMTHGIESPDRFVLLVEWDSVASHEAFRASDAFGTWRSHIGPHLAGPPHVEHFADL